MPVILFSTDTPHHRYFINRLSAAGIRFDRIYFETNHVTPGFVTGPFCEEEENKFEDENFFTDVCRGIEHANICVVKSINGKFVAEDIKSVGANFGVVFGTGIIREHIIDKFNDGLINIHRGISQLYRGLDSDLWAIYHEDYENIGVTVHMVDKELDTGNIVRQERITIDKDTEIFQLRYRTSVVATNLVADIIKKYHRDGNIGKTYKQSKGCYYSFMPLDLKHVVRKKLNLYRERLANTHEGS